MDSSPDQILLYLALAAGVSHLIGLVITFNLKKRFRTKLWEMIHDAKNHTVKSIMEHVSAKYFRPEIPIASVFVLTFWVMAIKYGGFFAFFAFIYSLFLVFRISYYLGTGADVDRLTAAEHMAEDFMVEGKVQEFERLAWALGMSYREQIREAGFNALVKWGSPETAAWLFNMEESNNVQMLLEAKKTGDNLITAMKEINAGNWKPLPWLEDNYVFWQILTKDIHGGSSTELLSGFLQDEKVPASARKFIQTLFEMQQQPKVGYCKQDRVKAIEGSVGNISFLVCPVCNRVDHIHYPVQHVTGQIGGNEAWKLEKDKLTLQVWDKVDRFTHLAEVDRLEVFPGETTDWALAAFVEEFANRFPRKTMEIQLHEGVELIPNTQKLMATSQHTMQTI